LENNCLAGFGRLATAKLGEQFYTDAVEMLGRNGLELLDLDKLKRPNGRDSVYNMIVKKKITSVFELLNNGDYEYALSDIGTTFEHHFAGKHCLGEKRTSTEALRLWFRTFVSTVSESAVRNSFNRGIRRALGYYCRR
jgi:hypothetical protein